jgi:glyoxylase-like metal-dependent hydrolase (beta-lactamase superfamily II)
MRVHILDLHFQGRPKTIASYLIIGPEGPVLVETGPHSTYAQLITGLAKYGFSPADIAHVLVTHIHLDHAGAAGWLAREGAHIYVHHVGAPHLIDPAKLLTSATRIYGEKMATLWGEVIPIPAKQVTALKDGDKISVSGLTFTALATPGHAYHHHVFQVEDLAFTGDAAGIQLPGHKFVDLPSPPPEFNLELWQQTIELLLDLPVTAIYPTHFGRVDNWKQHLQDLSVLLNSTSEFIRRRLANGLERNEILGQYMETQRQRAQAAGMTDEMIDRYETVTPQYMSVDGIIRYWRKRAASADAKD